MHHAHLLHPPSATFVPSGRLLAAVMHDDASLQSRPSNVTSSSPVVDEKINATGFAIGRRFVRLLLHNDSGGFR